jgi:zinc protease
MIDKRSRLPNRLVVLAVVAAATWAAAPPVAATGPYCVVVSQQTRDKNDWRAVVDALAAKHNATVITYHNDVAESLDPLKRHFPRFTCFVTEPQKADRKFVADVHQLTRKFDDDPYTDTFWGILTGYDAQNAVRIARHAEPLTVRRVASGTELAMDMVDAGVWYCELHKNRMVRKNSGEEPKELTGPDDTTEALVAALNDYGAQLFVTSGHATEKDWQIGYRYRNGSFRCEKGQLYGRDTAGKRYPIDSPNPKVYMPIGNCLMGHINSPDAMALAWMNSAGVHQMIGYTVPTWFGYAGWGCLDYFVEQPGRFTFTEAFFANHHALVHRLATQFTTDDGQVEQRGDGRGLRFDRDVVAFYGDPAWAARMADGPLAWRQTLTQDKDVYSLVVTPQRGARTFQPVNTNGSQRGYRPIVAFLPHRIREVAILRGKDLAPTITDDFVLIPLPRDGQVKSEYRVEFRASRVEG